MTRLTERQRQWLWFVLLAAGGMAAMLLLAGMVRFILNVGT
jgi:hypothetical protein